MLIRPAGPADRAALESFLARWFSLRVARRGELVEPLEHPSLIAEEAGRMLGVVTYVVHGADCEMLTLHADERGQGVGTALIAAVKDARAKPGARDCGS